jgi:hypothetical protein
MTGFAAPGAVAPAVLPDTWITPQGIAVFRAANAGWTSEPYDDLPNMLWPARMLGDVELSQSAVDAIGVGGRVALSVGDISLWNGDAALSTASRYGTADGRAIAIRVADAVPSRPVLLGADGAVLLGDDGFSLTAQHPESSLADAPVVWRGMIRTVTAAASQAATVSVVDVAERLATPLQASRYGGTGGLDGALALKDQPKPVCLGQVFNAEPVALGNVDLGDGALPTYQTNWRAVAAHDAVRIRGVAQTAVASTPAVGQYRDWPALGVFQLGSTPDGTVTADVRGDAVGGYANSIAGILRRLVTSLGPQLSADELHAEAWSFAEGDLPGIAGWYRGTSDITASDAAEQIVASCGAVLAGGRGGQLRLFDPLADDLPQFDIPMPWIIDLRPLSLPATLRPLPRAVGVEWQRNWKPVPDLAGSVDGAERQRLAGNASGPARAESALVTARVAQQRDMRFAGLYATEADALARAEKWRRWIEAGPRLFEIQTDRYLGQIECGDIGRVTYPAYGLAAGARGVVVAWREALAGRRLTLTIATLPES